MHLDLLGSGKLQHCSRDCAARWERRSNFGRSANGDDSLPLPVRGTGAGTDDRGKERGGVNG
jgi:hypothetical protein